VSRRIAVILGGRSSENPISVASAASVIEALERSGNDVVTVEIDRSGRWALPGAASNTLLQAPQAAELAQGAEDASASNTVLQAPGRGSQLERLPGREVTTTLADVDVVFPEIGRASCRERV